MNLSTRRGFTLIELLVVVTIIVVLLALLVPSLDKALYAAELTVCGTRQKGMVNSVTTYSLDFKRSFPYRDGVTRFGAQSYQLANGREGWDDRKLLKQYMPLNLFNDPLTGELNLDPEGTNPKSFVFSSFDLWFGFQYKTATFTGAGMMKLGDRFSWQGDRFSYLVSDRDVVHYNDGFAHNSHPDKAGVMRNTVRQDEFQPNNVLDETLGDPYTKARWESSNASPARGAVDLNYGSTDGSVVRVNDAQVRDERLIPVPEYANDKENKFLEWALYLAKP